MKKIVSSVLAAAVSLSGFAAFSPGVSVSDSLCSVTYAADTYFGGANPVISRGVPAYSGRSDSASSGNDEHYFTSWSSSSGDYLAYDLSGVPQSQRKKVLAAWYNLSSYDNLGAYASRNAEPIDYTIEVNKAQGGSYPSSGWETAVTVKGNGLSSRQHVVDMDGYNWIRMNVTKAHGDKVTLNLDIHDVSQGVFDSWIFFGDSMQTMSTR